MFKNSTHFQVETGDGTSLGLGILATGTSKPPNLRGVTEILGKTNCGCSRLAGSLPCGHLGTSAPSTRGFSTVNR